MAASLSLAARKLSESKRLKGYLFWQTLILNNNSVSFQKEDNSPLTTCELAREKATSICTPVSSKLSFLQTLTKPVSWVLSQEFHKLTAGDHIPPWPTNTPHLFVSFFFPSEQLCHLPAQDGTELGPPCWYCTNYQARGWVNYLYWCQCHHTASPTLPCTALFYTPASPAAVLSHLGQATLGTS